jgi:hypothetical protein
MPCARREFTVGHRALRADLDANKWRSFVSPTLQKTLDSALAYDANRRATEMADRMKTLALWQNFAAKFKSKSAKIRSAV